MDDFKFDVGDVVLAEWEDKLFYAKIQKIDSTKSYCHLIFDDNSVEECPFSKIHSGLSLISHLYNFFIQFGFLYREIHICLNPVGHSAMSVCLWNTNPALK